MGIKQIRYTQVDCDFPAHTKSLYTTTLGKDMPFHLLQNQHVICADCWNNKMTVEELLDFMNISHVHTTREDYPDK